MQRSYRSRPVKKLTDKQRIRKLRRTLHAVRRLCSAEWLEGKQALDIGLPLLLTGDAILEVLRDTK